MACTPSAAVLKALISRTACLTAAVEGGLEGQLWFTASASAAGAPWQNLPSLHPHPARALPATGCASDSVQTCLAED